MSDTTTPNRIQLRRARGWRLPPNTVKVDRSTKWGNPFVVGSNGTRAECVDLFEKLLAGYVCMTRGDPIESERYLQMALRDRGQLAGKNLACWCPLDQPCHADVLLRLAALATPAAATLTPAGTQPAIC